MIEGALTTEEAMIVVDTIGEVTLAAVVEAMTEEMMGATRIGMEVIRTEMAVSKVAGVTMIEDVVDTITMEIEEDFKDHLLGELSTPVKGEGILF